MRTILLLAFSISVVSTMKSQRVLWEGTLNDNRIEILTDSTECAVGYIENQGTRTVFWRSLNRAQSIRDVKIFERNKIVVIYNTSFNIFYCLVEVESNMWHPVMGSGICTLNGREPITVEVQNYNRILLTNDNVVELIQYNTDKLTEERIILKM